eukprot:10458434-Alexandrium_andersonii.AAC.1
MCIRDSPSSSLTGDSKEEEERAQRVVDLSVSPRLASHSRGGQSSSATVARRPRPVRSQCADCLL